MKFIPQRYLEILIKELENTNYNERAKYIVRTILQQTIDNAAIEIPYLLTEKDKARMKSKLTEDDNDV